MKVLGLLFALLAVSCSQAGEKASQEGYARGHAEALDCVRSQGGDAKAAADACDE
jgi:hypothetical protein